MCVRTQAHKYTSPQTAYCSIYITELYSSFPHSYLLPSSSPPCEGCSAVVEDVGSFSLSTVNCQSLGVVSVTDRYFLNKGTVCGTVTNATANSICDSLNYGTAVRFGTAADLG